jgi:hypothetical protein
MDRDRIARTQEPEVRTDATFRSSAFNTSDVKPYFINPCCFGDDLAKWMMAQLRTSGAWTADEPGQEDFGWYFEFQVPAGRYCCVLGYQEDYPEGRWHLWLERSRGFLGSILGMRKRGIDAAAVQALQDILGQAPEIRELEWQDAP